MSIRTRLLACAAAAVAAVALSAGAVGAASGAFSASSSSPALRASNTGTGGGLDAASSKGSAISAHGGGYGVFGVTSNPAAAGVRGDSRSTVAGPGVLGVGKQGVVGTSNGRPGDGTYGVVSRQDALVSGHLIGENNDIGGYCTIPSGATSAPCTFSDAFGPSATPLVTLTPTSDPGGWFWTSGTTRSGFIAHRNQSGGALTFVFHVSGFYATSR